MTRLLVLGACILVFSSAHADEAIRIGNGYALLNKPVGKPTASLILIPGGDGNVGITADGKISPRHEPTTLPRNRKTLASHGAATLLIDNKISVGDAALYMKNIAQPIVVVALSGGTTRFQEMVQARPSGIILVSGVLSYAQKQVQRKDLPRTLIVHHREDHCIHTPPASVGSFQRWGGNRIDVEWITGGQEIGDPCYAFSYHGLLGRDEQFRELVLKFSSVLEPATPMTTSPIPNLLARTPTGSSPPGAAQPLPSSDKGERKRCKSC